MTFLMGGITVSRADNPMVSAFALIAGFFDLAEEIAANAMDVAGDKMRASKPLAIVHGKRTALNVSRLLFGVVVLLTFIPILLGETSLAYINPDPDHGRAHPAVHPQAGEEPDPRGRARLAAPSLSFRIKNKRSGTIYEQEEIVGGIEVGLQ